MRLPRLSVRILSASLLCSAALVAQDAPPFEETIDVREVELLFDLSDLPPFESIGRKAIEDFSVVEGGASFALIGMERVDAADWTQLLYFDSVLAGPDARRRAATALAARAPRLAGGGLVEVVVADPRPRVVLTTRDPVVLRNFLVELAVAKEVAPPSRGESDRIRQVDRLVLEIAQRGGGGPRALWLPVDGWPLSPTDLERWSQARTPGRAADPSVDALLEGGRALAGYGWITYPVALRDEREALAPAEAERRMRVESGGGGDERTSVAMFVLSGPNGRESAKSQAQMDTLMDFTLLPATELARATSGTLLGHESRLASELAELFDRRRATYRGPRPETGGLLPLELRWTGGDGRTLPSTRFLRSSTPPEVSAARLRSLLAGDTAPDSATVTVRTPVDSPRELCFGRGETLPVRLSIARETGAGARTVEVGAVRLLEASPDADRCMPLALPFTAGDRRIAWTAEALDGESWTGGVETPP